MADFATTLLPLAWDISRRAYNLASAGHDSHERSFPGVPIRTRKVLVAGLAGSGKTSVINALTGMNLETGDSAQGVTFNCQVTDERIYRKETSGEAVKMQFIDTVGFDAGAGGPMADGSLHRDAAFTNLMKLLRATSELDLIMYVMKKGRLTTADTTCYELLVKKIGYGLESTTGDKGRRIPVVLVITHCETENPANLQEWLGKKTNSVPIPGVTFVANGTNQQVLNSAGIDNANMVCTAFFPATSVLLGIPAFRECRNESVRSLLGLLVSRSDAGTFRAARARKSLLREINFIRYLFSTSYRRVSKDAFMTYLKNVFDNDDAERIYTQVVAQ